MSTKQKKKNKGRALTAEEKVQNKFKTLYIVIIALAISLVGVLIYLVIDKSDVLEPELQDYYNEHLNFSITMPYEWLIVEPDTEAVEEEVFKATGGLLFDMMLDPLEGEVVPVALVTEPKDEEAPFEKMMTLAYKGSDSKYSYLRDKVKLMDDLKHLLEGLDHENVKVEEVKDYNDNENFNGILLTASAELEGYDVSYYQYHEPAGANTLTITHGTTLKTVNAIEDIALILRHLLYHEGGAYFPSDLQDQIREESLNLEGDDSETSSKSDNVEVIVEGDSEIEVRDAEGNKIEAQEPNEGGE